MHGRLALLGLLLATMPVAIDVPGSTDTTRVATLHADLAGGAGQFALIARGCEGEILSETHDPFRSSGVDVGVTLPDNLIIGTRAGVIETKHDETRSGHWGSDSQPIAGDSTARLLHITNRFVNPYLTIEDEHTGFGVGLLISSEPFRIGEGQLGLTNVTGHFRVGGPGGRFALKWMESMPLESEGHLTAALDVAPPGRHFDGGVFAGLSGPYDGVILGARHRIWLTPEAAMQLKAAAGGHEQYGVWLTFTGVRAIR